MSAGPPPTLSEAAKLAVGSTSRLAVLLRCEQSPQTVRGLVEQLELSRQVIRHHLTVLEQAGLIHEVARQAVRGGTVVSYVATASGWAKAITGLNGLASES